MKYISNELLSGERALFMYSDVTVDHCVFYDGESPLKESKNVTVLHSEFRWKYPLWYSTNVKCHSMKFTETARSGIWYTKNIEIYDSNIEH